MATVGTTVATVAVRVRVKGAAAARAGVREAVVRVGEWAALGKLRLCLRGHFCSPLARSRRCLCIHRHLAPGWEIGNVR